MPKRVLYFYVMKSRRHLPTKELKKISKYRLTSYDSMCYYICVRKRETKQTKKGAMKNVSRN
nr:MAG TPA: hypothetical protein [Caudoviricetes sp.]